MLLAVPKLYRYLHRMKDLKAMKGVLPKIQLFQGRLGLHLVVNQDYLYCLLMLNFEENMRELAIGH